MCGFIGSVRWQAPDSKPLIGKLLDRLVHRGPDAGQVAQMGEAVFGHRRLAIIDLDTSSNQPMIDEEGNFMVAFNGEIYNYKELRADLQQRGVRFRTHSDTEVILEGWKIWGDSFVSKLRGMFTFALWNQKQGKLLLGRDRAGEKPLFYADLPDGIVFASELKALRGHPDIPLEVNPQALNQFLTLNYILSDCSILKHASKLPAAHVLSLERHQHAKQYAYWDLKDFFLHKKKQSERDAVEELQSLLDSAVKEQSVSDVPLGTFLSGGIDSSAITALLARQAKDTHDIKTFSMGFKEDSFSEADQARAMADFLAVSHYSENVHPTTPQDLERIVYHADEPFADTSILPMYHLAELARHHVKVALSGDGSDEIFAGYVTNTADRLHGMLQYVPTAALSYSHRAIQALLPVSFNKVSLDYKIRQFLEGVAQPFPEAHFSWRHIFNEEEKRSLLSVDCREAVLESNPFHSVKHYFDEISQGHPLDQAAYVDFKTWLVDDILVKVDRATMAHSLEARAPFLDHRVVEFAAQLDPSLKMKGWEKKYLLKKAMGSYLRSETLKQPKKGFNAPISQWLTGEMQDFAKQVTLDPALKSWFSLPFIEALWKQHLSLRTDHGLKLFGLTCFGVWLKQFQQETKVY